MLLCDEKHYVHDVYSRDSKMTMVAKCLQLVADHRLIYWYKRRSSGKREMVKWYKKWVVPRFSNVLRPYFQEDLSRPVLTSKFNYQ